MNTLPKWAQLVEEKTQSPFSLQNYNTHVFEDYNLTYVETPKNACTSVKRLLSIALLNKELKSSNVHKEFLQTLTRIGKLGPIVTQRALFGDYFRFAITRNPISRFISAYEDKIMTNAYERKRIRPKFGFETDDNIELIQFLHKLQAIEDLERDIHFMSQSRVLSFNRIEYDLLIDMNDYQEDITFLLERFEIDFTDNIRDVMSKHHNKNYMKNSINSLSYREEELIRNIYEEDFSNLGYI